jgi:hypothetical protein
MAEDSALDNWTREDARLSVDLIDAFGGMENKIAGGRFEAAPRRQPMLALSGVQVSVHLDLLMTRSRGPDEEVGGVLFRLSKADDGDTAIAKRQEMGLYAATLALMQVRANLSGGRISHHQLCASFDVQAGDVHFAPRTFVRRAQDMESACRFIAAMWSTA